MKRVLCLGLLLVAVARDTQLRARRVSSENASGNTSNSTGYDNGTGNTSNSAGTGNTSNSTSTGTASNSTGTGNTSNSTSTDTASNSTGTRNASNSTSTGTASNSTGSGSTSNSTGTANSTDAGSASNSTTSNASNSTGTGSTSNATGTGNVGNSTGGRNTSHGGYPSNYSYGNASNSSGHNYSIDYCSEMWCYPNVYMASGEIDWNATYSANHHTCASYDEGCPCNTDWELQCDSYGYKVCAPKSEGCYDPFAVECATYEHVCTDQWSAFCWDKIWGDCPVYCTSEQTYCYAYSYANATGEINYTAPYREFCANMADGCPCDETWEDKCTDFHGYSWCTPKIYPCPLECTADEQLCYSTAYFDDGEPDWSTPQNQSCVALNGSCPCDALHEEKCTDWWGSYCQPKAYGSCPLSCQADEIYCYETPYDEVGQVIWDAVWQETCHPAAEGCPCSSQWEKKCTDSEGGWSWCIPSWDSCPVDCGLNPTCYHWSGNQSCGTSSGCSCEADEHTCQDAAGYTECYAKAYYESGCPLVCNYDTHLYCYEVGFDSSGLMTWREFCHAKTSDDAWECPVICQGESAKKCEANWGAYCVTLDDTCPEVCTSEEQNCWVTDYSVRGEWLGGRDVCAPADEACPCGDNSQLCTDSSGYSYCESSHYGCPVVCGVDEKSCYPVSYTPEGEWDYSVAVNETCVTSVDTCPCGANAKPCKWTDDWGYEEEYCMPDAESCPVTCTEGQKRCYKTDYNSSGYPESYSESCVLQDATCQCGRNSQSCYDPWFNEDFCYPTWDFWSTVISCPVYCKDNEDYCYVPSYAQGDYLSFHEYCVPSGEKCDCSRGQNTFECTWKDPFYGDWTECLPTTGGYCPATCSGAQVACNVVEDYLPNGTSLGWFSPPRRCADSVEQCPCGKEAERCPGYGCIFKDEGCPVTCAENQKKCYIVDYNADGDFISDREACVALSEACPCGKHTAKCENSDVCLSRADAAIVCPCKASERECLVVDYGKDGTATKFKTECVKEGHSCPCGKNSISCPDPNDAVAKLCSASFEHKKCPAPCTAEGILAGNKTCVQINLDSKGDFKSEAVTCIGPDQTCPAGEGMKACPSSARIKASQNCMNLYSPTDTARRLSGRKLSSATRSTCNAIITLTSVRSGALRNAENVRVQMNSVLQIPSGLSTTLALKTSSRRLEASRALQSSAGTLIYSIDDKGVAGTVTPAQVCEQLKKMVKSSNPDMTKALADLGVINAQAGVNLETSSSSIFSRSQAAKDQRAAQAGVTTRSTTIAPTASTVGPTTGSTTEDGSEGGGDAGPLRTSTATLCHTLPVLVPLLTLF